MSDNQYVVTQKEAADFLNVSTKSISRYRKRGLPYKLVLNPGSGKQEVRFRYADLERWDEGRQLLATYARDGEDVRAAGSGPIGGRSAPAGEGTGSYLEDLLLAYRDQIELLKDQLEDMREQLARRDRQMDDLMRLMVGLQLEYKPLDTERPPAEPQSASAYSESGRPVGEDNGGLYEALPLSALADQPAGEASVSGALQAPMLTGKKIYTREELARSIRRLRAKGKSYEQIARGLNEIQVATVSGQPQWTVSEVQNLLPQLVVTPLAAVLSDGELD
jgi:hypothetical protein